MAIAYRVAFVVAGLVAVVAAYALPLVLPGVRYCDGWCTRGFDPGDVGVFGRYTFTLAQTLVLVAGIWAGASLLSRAILPRRHR